MGGIHPIIVPEDAIQHADAICTGEGEFAFAEFFDAFKNGRDYLRFMDFSLIPGRTAGVLWRLGIVRCWNRHFVRKFRVALKPISDENTTAQPSTTSLPVISNSATAKR